MGRICTVVLTMGFAASAWAELPPNVAKNAKAAKAAVNSPAPKRTGKSKPPAVKQNPVPEPQPTPAQPVVPLRPSQLPSVPPRVSYQQGQLTVIAENSTLGDIFGAIRNATGIKIETQGGPSGDRVAAKIGPAAPKEVLLSLLQGSRYDYVMLGGMNDPEQVERVILTPKVAGGTATASAPAQPQISPQQPRPDANQDSDSENADEEDPGQPMLRGQEPPQQPQQQPQPPTPGAAVPAPNGQNPPTNPGQVRTPEQILQELRERQQQIQQQQQQQQGTDPNRPR